MTVKATVLLVAGGTGGHLFPAEALGSLLKKRGFDVHLLTDKRAKHFITTFSDDHVHVVRSATLFSKNPLKLIHGLFQLLYGVSQSRKLIRNFKPCLVAGFGGYPTLPPLYAATTIGLPTFIHEQNAVMGRTNRLFASRVNIITSGFLKAEGKFSNKIIVTGNPLREDVIKAARIPYRIPRKNTPFSLLIFGGSQGSTFFSRILPQALTLVDRAVRDRLFIVQQARTSDVRNLIKSYERLGIKADVQIFFDDLPWKIARAHYVIARSGASTVAEIAAIGRPALMVPYPDALDQDQMKNATILALSGGANVIRQEKLKPEWLAALIQSAVNEPDRLESMAEAIRIAACIRATERLADITQSLIAGKSLDMIKKEVV